MTEREMTRTHGFNSSGAERKTSGILGLWPAFWLWLGVWISLRLMYAFLPAEPLEATWKEVGVAWLRSGADALWICMPFMGLCIAVSGKWLNRIWAFCRGGWLTGWALAGLANLWYARHFGTPIHYSDWMLVQNLDGLGPAVTATIRVKDFLILLPGVLGYLFGYGRCRVVPVQERSLRHRAYRLEFTVFVICFCATCLLFVWSARKNYAGAGYNRNLVLTYYGVFHLVRYDYLAHRPPSSAEIQSAWDYLSKRKFESGATYSPAEDKNLILILVESLGSWPIGGQVVRETDLPEERGVDRISYAGNSLRGEGISTYEVTPCLNRLVKQEGVDYWPYMLPQTKDGRSSDAQLMVNTGLLPVRVGATSGMYAHHEFPSLPKALKKKGYRSYSFICDDASFWNQQAISVAFGFDALYDKHDLAGTSQNINDSVLLAKVTACLDTVSSPFYAQVVTLSGHCPYVRETCPDLHSPFLRMRFPSAETAYYLAAVHYTDRCIGRFLDFLKSTSLYSESVIVIAGDHEDHTLNRLEGRLETRPEDTFIPFIVINGGMNGLNKESVVAQSDIYPTLLELMGVWKYSFTGLGESLLHPSSAVAVSREGVCVGVSDSATCADLTWRWTVSDILVRGDCFRIHSAE